MHYFVEFYANAVRLNQREHIGTRSLRAASASDAEAEARTLLASCHRDQVDFVLLFTQPERGNTELVSTIYR